jgi:hypothetical protein
VLKRVKRWLARLIRYSPRMSDAQRKNLGFAPREKMRYIGLGDPGELAARIRQKLLREEEEIP